MNPYSTGSHQKAGLFLSGAAVRLTLFLLFPSLPDLLTGRIEISTPVSSFKRLQEGLFLYNHNLSPYDGGVFHQAPLLLTLFSLLPNPSSWPIFTYLLYIAVDLLCADALITIANSGEAGGAKLFISPRRSKKWSGYVIAAVYLFNPLNIATCVGRSTSVFTTCSILYAVANAVSGKPFHAIFAWAMASYLEMYPALLLPPLLLLCYDRQPTGEEKPLGTFMLRHVQVALSNLLFLFLLSYFFITWDTSFLSSTWGVQLTLSDLTPTIGLWWYFFIEMFDSFRSFFLAVFWLHLCSYVGGLSVRIRTQPLVVITVLLGIFAIFKPYPSIADAGLFLSMVPLFRHVFPLMRYSFLTGSTILYSAVLGPAFYHLWIYAGSGNANFFYAITLVWSLGLSILVSDLTFAILRDEWEVERPEMVGKDIRQI